MRVSWDDSLEDALKAVEQSAAQWPGVEVMVDFCQTGDSPCPQLEIKAKRRANILLGSMFLIQAGSKYPSCLMIDSWLLAPFCNQTISDEILGGCIFWCVTCSLEAGLGPLVWPIVEVPEATWVHRSYNQAWRVSSVWVPHQPVQSGSLLLEICGIWEPGVEETWNYY